jgi:hypothetical protein
MKFYLITLKYVTIPWISLLSQCQRGISIVVDGPENVKLAKSSEHDGISLLFLDPVT